MMKKITLLLTLAFALFFNLSASENNDEKNSSMEPTGNTIALFTLSGTVYDSNGNEILSGASIMVDGKKYYSDLSGNFIIPRLPKGKHTLSVSFISYQSQTIEINLSKDEDIRIAIKQL
jgi:hypothetical protein